MKVYYWLALFLLPLPHGRQEAITRGDTSVKKLSIVFTGDEFADGAGFITNTLHEKKVKGSFFLTGNFYRNSNFKKIVDRLKSDGHYLGSHSDKHLLYCDWTKRDSLLVTKEEFDKDLSDSYKEMSRFNVKKSDAYFFLPPYEWYNDSIVSWTSQAGLQLINYTPGTRSTADYTYPEMNERYVSSDSIYRSITGYEKREGLNGFILLVHIGTDPRRTDKFYRLLPELIDYLQKKNYEMVRIDELLKKR